MKKTLYLLRKPVDRLNPALFLPSESQGDVVLLEDVANSPFPYEGGVVWSLTSHDGDRTVSYETLVKTIFAYERTVVI